MDIIEAIRERRSIRVFKPEPVPEKILKELLDISRWAPSGGNAQPWHFAVLGGKVLDEVKARYAAKVKTCWDGTAFQHTNPDFARTGPYPEVLASRVQGLRKRLDSALYPPGTPDVEQKRLEYVTGRQRFFDAPNAIIVYADDKSPTAILDIGIVTQTICLAALYYGLGTCIMGLMVLWPEIYRELIGIPQDKPIATSIAIGYPDLTVPINKFRRPRESLNALVDWHMD